MQNQKLESAKVKMYSQGNTTNAKIDVSGQVTIGGKTIDQWNRQWVSLEILSSLTLDDLTPNNHLVRLYKAVIEGKTYYIGTAIENNNGEIRKRLRDYFRESDSARTYK